MLENFTDLIKLLPLPWIVCTMSWIACGYVCKLMWERGNELQDKNLADVKDNAAKLAALNEKINDTLQALITAYQTGGKKRVR